MQKTIMITGATDGIGLAAAKKLHAMGHYLLLHGRNPTKLSAVEKELSSLADSDRVETYIADLSVLGEVQKLIDLVAQRHQHIDILINNAGIFKASEPLTPQGLDVRFVVNTIAPYLLTKKMLPLMGQGGRVINLSSAAQSPVDLQALMGQQRIDNDFEAYAQSKLAITAWSRSLAEIDTPQGSAIISVNPGSMLGSKMVKQAFGVAGKDINIGADILTRAAMSDEFETANGKYFDNDSGSFASPHADALNPKIADSIIESIESVLGEYSN
ncbi:MAG: SDR family NAD(P)-dependent oxidoreductase [Candidatus Thiodiazotropha sp. (ex. Lucinisca nassula)]|nr:SDR family NAD(P)-dependent oxidoreductase [Candidatus Thiodiazotropha sp. (ex. Lucinisca nassula)]